MDIRCPKCGEPWDADCLHDEVKARSPEEPWRVKGQFDQKLYEPRYHEVRKDFYAHGCEALDTAYGPGLRCEKVESSVTAAASAIYELLGDDIDGAAALLDDFEKGH